LLAVRVSHVAAQSLPTAPMLSVVPGGPGGSITVQWTNVNAQSYNVLWSTDPNGSAPKQASVSGSATQYTIAGLVSGTTYYIAVIAINTGPYGPLYSPVSNVVQAQPATAFSVLSVVPGGPPGTITIQWTPSIPTPLGYWVMWSTDPKLTGDYDGELEVGGNTTSFTIPQNQLAPAYTYYMTLVPNYGSNNHRTNVVGARPYFPPPAPTGLTYTATSTNVTLTWAAVPNATSYEVDMGMSSTGPWARVGTPAGLSFTSPTLQVGVIYYFMVRAFDAGGPGALSPPIGVTVKKTSLLN